MFVQIVFWRLHEHSPNGKTREADASEMKRRFEALVGVMRTERRGVDYEI